MILKERVEKIKQDQTLKKETVASLKEINTRLGVIDRLATISNDIKKHLEITSHKDIKEVLNKLDSLIDKIKNNPNTPINVSGIDNIERLLNAVSKNGWPTEPKDAIPVVLTDKQKKEFYNALSSIAVGSGGSNGKIIGSSGNIADVTVDGKLKVDASVVATVDTTGLATEDKQDDIITAIGNITVPAPVGGATSDNQTNGSQKTQIVDAGGEAVTVTGGKLDVNASIDTTGLATSAKQDTGNASLSSIDTKIDSLTTPSDTQPISVTSLPLPTGASTSDKQDTVITHLSNIDAGKLEETTFTGRVGEVQATPTANTLLGRIKSVEDKLDTLNTELSAKTEPADTQTISGTVTANLSATDNTVLDNIDTDLTTLIGAVDGVEALLTTIDADTSKIPPQGQALASASMPVVLPADQITTLTPPAQITGFATSAKQDTIIGHVDGIETLIGTTNTTLGTIDTDTSNISTKIDTIAGAVSGSEMQVDIVGALPAGTNAIGKLLPPDIDVTAHTNYVRKYYTSAGAATDGIVWSPAAGKRWHVVTMYIQTSADATITLEDDKAGGDDPVWKGEIAGKSGVVLSFTEKYPMASSEDAADLTVTTSAGNVYITCVGYEI